MAELLEKGGLVSLWSGWSINLPQSYNERNDDGSWCAWGHDWTVDIHIIDTDGDADGNPVSAEKLLESYDLPKFEGEGWIGNTEILKENDNDIEVFRLAANLATEKSLMSCWVSFLKEEQLECAKSLVEGIIHEKLA